MQGSRVFAMWMAGSEAVLRVNTPVRRRTDARLGPTSSRPHARQAPEPGLAATVRKVDLRQARYQGLAGRAAARRSAGPAHRSNPAG